VKKATDAIDLIGKDHPGYLDALRKQELKVGLERIDDFAKALAAGSTQ